MPRRVRGALAAAALTLSACAAQTVSGSGAAPTLSPHTIFALAAPATLQVFGPVGSMMSPQEFAFGSGVLIDKGKQLALTNAHVVDGVSSLAVRFNDGTQSDAEVLGRSPCDDIAVLHLDHVPADATALPLSESSTVQPGDPVSVLGYPATLASIRTEHVVFTQGLVQSVHVRVDQFADLPVYVDTIQHSATINHGNSGGPLLDGHAHLVGINTLSNFGTPDQQVQGQFYSISSDHIRPLLTGLESGRSIAYAGWDLAPLAALPLAKLFPATGYGTAAQGKQADQNLARDNVDGLVVTNVIPGTPASTAGVRPGVLLTRIADTPVATVPQACGALSSTTDSVPIAGLSLVSDAATSYTDSWGSTLTLR